MFLSLSVPSQASSNSLDSLYASFLRNFHIFPEYHAKVDLTTFAFHKDTYFKQQYLAEFNTGLELMMISFRQLLYSVWYVNSKIGLGDIPGNNVFSVLNIHFTISPTLEARFTNLILYAGYTHLCVHEVDRKNYPVIFYNAPSIGIGSPNMRVSEYWKVLTESANWTFKNKIGWRLTYLNFMKDGLGLADPGKLNGHNPYSHEIRTEGRYAVILRRSWIVTIHEQLRFGQYDPTDEVDHGGLYWSQTLGTEIFFRKGIRGAAMYFNFILDDLPMVKSLTGQYLPVFSKDKLLEIGLTFFD
jgi:hypothetical protein